MPGRTSLVHILTHAHSNADVAFHAVMLQAARQADGRTLQKAGERPPVVETSRILWDRIVSKSGSSLPDLRNRGPNGRLSRRVTRRKLDFHYSTQNRMASLPRNVASIESTSFGIRFAIPSINFRGHPTEQEKYDTQPTVKEPGHVR